MMKADILVFASHPDDAELACGGTLIRHLRLGYTVGIVDLTRGEMGTRGSVELRAQESEKASRIMGLSFRENLGLPDVYQAHDDSSVLEMVWAIRKYRPSLILANAIKDRHPDHGRGASLAEKAWFWSGLKKIEDKEAQEPWRAGRLMHYIQDRYISPDLVVDISQEWDTKMQAIKAFSSQFYNPDSKEPETYISKPEFLRFLESRALEMGRMIGTLYGEGFVLHTPPGIGDLMEII